ncbi:MAG: DUF389 domain-containing protein [Odoribacter sp.]|nr:DUF389 domain-containing protein [Odoribacter sp.]
MNFSELFLQFQNYLKGIFDPSEDRESEVETIENICKGINFRGSNLWVLIFAIFIASLGLNVNSTAVIIGAMLISPLMGPIMGIGLGLGINDFELIKKAFRNLAIATVFGILTSTFYFLISTLNEARSELLARTTPTIYDVLIAFFGGMAGIVASSTRLKGNVIPGVAIATALMPPLCTAGFGIASGNFSYFFGAFYLYMINSVFIAFATTLGVKLMHFSKKTFVDKARGKRVQQLVYTILFLTIVPSVYITYNMIRKNIFQTSADRFIVNEINFPNTFVVNKYIDAEAPDRKISVSLVGKEVPEESIIMLRQKMEQYGLENVRLDISQGFGKKEEDAGREGLNNLVLQDFYRRNQEKMKQQVQEINYLKSRLEKYTVYDSVALSISPELKILFPYIRSIAVSRLVRTEVELQRSDTLTVAFLSYQKAPVALEEECFKSWLATRLKVPNVEIIRY